MLLILIFLFLIKINLIIKTIFYLKNMDKSSNSINVKEEDISSINKKRRR